MKKLLYSTVMLLDLASLLFAIGLPFANPWWFIFSFAVIIIHIPYGEAIQDWVFRGLEA